MGFRFSKRFLEIDSGNNKYERFYARGDSTPSEVPSDILIFQVPKEGYVHRRYQKGFAKTTSYTVEAKALARLPHHINGVPPIGGYLVIKNLEVLLKRMEALGVDVKA